MGRFGILDVLDFNSIFVIKNPVFFFCLLAVSSVTFSQNIDSLKLEFNNALTDSLKGSLLYTIGSAHSDNDSAISYFNKALVYEVSLKNEFQVASITYAIGLKKYKQNQLDSAIHYWEIAANNFANSYTDDNVKELDDLLANCYYSIGLGYYYSRNYSKSVSSIQSSLKLRLTYDDANSIIRCYNILGIIHLGQEEYDEAEEYLNKGLNLAIEKGDTSSMVNMYVNLASIYVETKRYTKALGYSQMAYELNGGVSNSANTPTKINIGYIYMHLNQLDTARIILREGVKVFAKSGDVRGKITSLNLLGDLYVKTEEWNNLIDVSTRCMVLYDSYNDVQEQKNTAYNLSVAYDNLGNEHLAYKNFKLYTAYKDSLFNQEKAKEIDRLEARYEFEKKEKDIAVLTEENLLKEIELAEDRKIRLIIFGVVGFFTFVFAILFLLYKRNQEQKRHKLALKKMEIEQRMLRSQMNPHFIFNALNSIQSYISTNSSYQAEVFLSKFSLLVRNILENSTQEFIELDKEIETLTLYLELEKLRFEGKFTYHIQVELSDSSIKVPPMLVQPFVENAIIHGMKGKATGGKIDIFFKDAEDEMIRCEVVDNGVGRLSNTNKTSGHKSLSTTLTNDRIQFFNQGKGAHFKISIIDLQDEEGKPQGTKVELLIPVTF